MSFFSDFPSILAMSGTLKERTVDRTEFSDFKISTVQVYDGFQPYETAVCHPDFNDGCWIIVEAYDAREKAAEGHAHWEAALKEQIPDTLTDCINSSSAVDSFYLSSPVFKRKLK